MPDDRGPNGPWRGDVIPREHRRILVIMAVLGLIFGMAGAVLSSVRFGAGIVLGVAIAIVNYFWLRHSLNKIVAATKEGEKPRLSMLRYLGRYLALGAVIAVIYVSGVVPIVPLVLGIAAFGFAVTADGLIRIFSSFHNRKEI